MVDPVYLLTQVSLKFHYTHLFRCALLLILSKASTIHIYSDITFIRNRRVSLIFQIVHKIISCISPFRWTDWMSRRRSRFYNPNCKQYHKSSAAIRRNNQPATGSRVYRDSSYFKFLAKKFVNSEHSSDNFIELLNASELAKSRKTWPFFSESCL